MNGSGAMVVEPNVVRLDSSPSSGRGGLISRSGKRRTRSELLVKDVLKKKKRNCERENVRKMDKTR